MFAKSMASYLESSGYGTIDKDIFINLFPSRTDILLANIIFSLSAS